MNWKRKMVCAMVAAMAAASPAVSLDGDVGMACAYAQTDQRQYKNGDMVLLIPKAYDDLLTTEIEKERIGGVLFQVSEKASIDAVKHLPNDTRGAGWLFSIGYVDEGLRRVLLCGDMSGAEIFARDANGQCYIYYHPTDVRYMRENNEAMKRDQAQWTMLNEWAWNSVRTDFIRENHLETAAYDNSEVGIAIARAAYKPGVRYTVSTTEYGPIEPKGFDAAPFAELLLENAVYERTDAETPDGEYVVLAFPDEGLRYDFFKLQGHENYVREVRPDGTETLYKAIFFYGSTRASVAMQDWYDALVAQQNK